MSDDEPLSTGLWRMVKRGVLMKDLDEEGEDAG